MKERVWLILRLIAAGILAQTLFFKFTAAPEAVYIFTTLGIEPWGRILVGTLEGIAVLGLLITPFVVVGALVGAGLMIGALGIHLFKVGIIVQNDGGLLFGLALLELLLTASILWKYIKKGASKQKNGTL